MPLPADCIVGLGDLLNRGVMSAVELTTSCLDEIQQVDGKLHAYLAVCPDSALRSARESDARRSSGTTIGPLDGIPFAAKDVLCTTGIPTTCGSRILQSFIPPYSATAVDRLISAGAILLGKLNCDEFAMGSSTENSAFGPTRNPWNADHVPGGSSGGSAAAVAGGLAPFALGSDTGGSIRQPAALCGVVGVKPSYGRVSRYGLVAYASSLDQVGPLTTTVEDAALVLHTTAGKDFADSTTVDLPVPDYQEACSHTLAGLRIGLPTQYFGIGIDAGVATMVRAAVDALCSHGAHAEECSLPSTECGIACYYILASAEASSNLARYDGVKYGHRTQARSEHIDLSTKTRSEGFGDEVKQRIMIGTYALSAGYYDAYYKRAQQARTLLRQEFEQAFDQFDVLITPTSPTTAFKLGERSHDPMAMKLADICTIPANLAGLCGISVPCGVLNGLPVGLQILAAPFAECKLFRAAAALERISPWQRIAPQQL